MTRCTLFIGRFSIRVMIPLGATATVAGAERPKRVARTTPADLYDAKGNEAGFAWVRAAAAGRFLV